MALHWGGPVLPHTGRNLLQGLVAPALGDLQALLVAPDRNREAWDNPESETEVLDLFDRVVQAYPVDRDRTLLCGYSLGGIGTWFMAGRNQDRFRAALPISARPPSVAADVAWRIPLYVIHSRRDEIFPREPVETAVSQLNARGTTAHLVIIDNITHYETHRFVEPLRGVIPWIEETWQQASR